MEIFILMYETTIILNSYNKAIKFSSVLVFVKLQKIYQKKWAYYVETDRNKED